MNLLGAGRFRPPRYCTPDRTSRVRAVYHGGTSVNQTSFPHGNSRVVGGPPCAQGLEHVLILVMDYGLVLFTSDRGITPPAAAKLADDHGFTTFYVPEHTHIPIKREAAHPTTGD